MPERRAEDQLVGDYSEEVLELCRANWLRRMVQEHQAAAVFSNMLPQLIEAEAPIDVKTAVLRSSMDELRHARLCGEVAELLGASEAVAQADLSPQPLAPHPNVPAKERALRNLFFVGCLSETVAVALLTEERARCEEPYIARVLKALTADETLHARVGWIYLGLVWPELDADARERFVEYLRVALAYYETCIVNATPHRIIPEDVLIPARRIGFAHSEVSRELFYETMESVVIPQLETCGLPARQAWLSRQCSDDVRAGSTTLTR